MARATAGNATSGAVLTKPPISPATRDIPSVEIYQNQQSILIRKGQSKTITITGAVYDQPFTGDITLQPDPDFSTGCPLFGNVQFNGVYTNLSIPANGSVALNLVVTGPTSLPPGDYTCKLKYDAEYSSFPFPTPVGKGNPVYIKYTLKNKKRKPTDPDL